MLSFGDYTSDFLELSWEWLNDPELKELTMTPNFTKDDQRRFYQNLSQRVDYRIFGISLFGEKIGACGLKNISVKSGEYWGYIGNKRYWGHGYGKEIIAHIEDLARALKLRSIYLKVSKENIRAIHLYTKNKFTVTIEHDGYYLMERYL